MIANADGRRSMARIEPEERMKNDRGPPLSRRAFLELSATLGAAAALPAGAAAPRGSPRQVPQIWFVRAAQSEIDLPSPARNVRDEGINHPLTRQGIEQARSLARSLAQRPISAIYTSTRLRAIQTADALAFEHGLPLSLAPEASEIDLGWHPASAQDPRAIYADLTQRWIAGEIDARHGKGESYADLQKRFLPFVREIMNRHAHDPGIVVLVSHGVTLAFMIPVLADNVPVEFTLGHPLPHAGIVKTELRDSRLYCTDWAGIVSGEMDG